MQNQHLATEFIKAIKGSEHAECVFTVLPGKNENLPRLGQTVYRGELGELWATLSGLNEAGYSISVSINDLDARGISNENVCGLRALFVDFDDGRRVIAADGTRLMTSEPSVIVRSGRGDHAYWLLEDEDYERVEDFAQAQKQLNGIVGADGAICDARRAMRMPGFVHWPSGELVTLDSSNVGSRYTIEQVLSETRLVGQDDPRMTRMQKWVDGEIKGAKGQPNGGRNAYLFSAAQRFKIFGFSSAEEIRGEVERLNQAVCLPPLDAREIDDILDHATRYSGRLTQDDATLKINGVEYIIPAPYVMQDGVLVVHKKQNSKGNEMPVVVCPSRIVVTSVNKNVLTGAESVSMEWGDAKRGDICGEHETPKDQVLVANSLASLSRFGVPVCSDTSKDLSKYIFEFLNKNKGTIARRATTAQTGWVDGRGFCLPNEWINDIDAKNKEPITLESPTEITTCVTREGSFSEWRDAIMKLVPYPKAMIGIIASCATPLLKPLRTSGFALSWAYTTSSGKTTALQAASSCWAAPKESDSRFVCSWSATLNAIAAIAGVRNDLPLLLDETKRARNSQQIAEAVYMVANGGSRNRCDVRGDIIASKGFRAIMLTTGESRLSDFTKDGGSAARIIDMWGSPFGGQTAETAAVIAEVNRVIEFNYGHAGPMIAAWAANNTSEAMSLRKNKQMYASMYAHELRGRVDAGIAERISDHIAHLRVAENVMKDVLEMYYDGSVVDAVFREVYLSDETGIEALDRDMQALQHVVGWAMSRQKTFVGREGASHVASYSGIWDVGGDLLMYPHILEQALREGGFEDTRSIMAKWRERKIIDCDAGRLTKRVRHPSVNGARPYVVHFVSLGEQPEQQQRLTVMPQQTEISLKPTAYPEPHSPDQPLSITGKNRLN